MPVLLPFALKWAREHEAGISQAELAQRAGLSKSYVAMLETGRRPNPSRTTVEALADALGVRLDQIAVECPDREESEGGPALADSR